MKRLRTFNVINNRGVVKRGGTRPQSRLPRRNASNERRRSRGPQVRLLALLCNRKVRARRRRQSLLIIAIRPPLDNKYQLIRHRRVNNSHRLRVRVKFSFRPRKIYLTTDVDDDDDFRVDPTSRSWTPFASTRHRPGLLELQKRRKPALRRMNARMDDRCYVSRHVPRERERER